MRFSTVVSTLAIAGGIADATLHSGRSLRHVGKKDKPIHKARDTAPRREQKHEKRDASFPYLTNSTASKYFECNIVGKPLIPFFFNKWRLS